MADSMPNANTNTLAPSINAKRKASIVISVAEQQSDSKKKQKTECKEIELTCQQGLQLACRLGWPKLARRALKQGLNLLNPMHWDKGYIQTAAISGCVEVVKILLDAGVPVNSVDARKHTALEAAIRFNQPHIVKYLIEKGANVNVYASGISALQTAVLGTLRQPGVRQVSIATVKMLLNAGADVHCVLPADIPHSIITETAKGLAVLGQTAALPKDRAAFGIVIAMLKEAMTFQVTEDAIEIPAAELQCSICHDVTEQKDWCHVSCCNSQFHVGCMTHWLECSKNNDCPLCRGQARNGRKVVPI